MASAEVGPLIVWQVDYEFVAGRYRYKKSCKCLAPTKECAEKWIHSICPGIDYCTISRHFDINGISDEIAEKIAKTEYPILKREEQLTNLQNRNFDKYARTAQAFICDMIHIVSNGDE